MFHHEVATTVFIVRQSDRLQPHAEQQQKTKEQTKKQKRKFIVNNSSWGSPSVSVSLRGSNKVYIVMT